MMCGCWHWLLLVTLFSLAASDENDSIIINSFLQAKQLTSCTFLTCSNTHEKVKMMKNIMKGHMVLMENLYDHKPEEEYDSTLRMDYGKLGVILDLSCKSAGAVFSWATKNKKFNSNYFWLIIENGTNNTKLRGYEIQLNLESEVVWVIKTATGMKVYEVYHTGPHPHGQLVVTEVPKGQWSVRKWKLDTRLDLQGLSLNVTEVVKPNSVAGLGTTHISDVSELQDRDEIVQYLTDDYFPHVDSMSKFSWAVFMVLKDFSNFSIRLVPTASWGYIFNGKFDGMVSLLVNGSADVGATTLAIRQMRLAVVDYTTQIWPYQPLFIFRHPRGGTLLDIFLRPLSPNVWLYSGAIILLMFIILLTTSWILRHHQLPSDNLSVSGTAIIIISAVAQQGSSIVPKQSSTRILYFFLFSWAMLLYQFYTSSIVSSLLSPSRHYINTLSDLVHSPFVIGFEKVLTTKDTLNRYREELPVVEEMYKKHVEPRGDGAYYTPIEGTQCIQHGQFAFYVDTASAYRLIEETLTQPQICDLVEITLNPEEVLALPLQKGSPYKKLFIYGSTQDDRVWNCEERNKSMEKPPTNLCFIWSPTPKCS